MLGRRGFSIGLPLGYQTGGGEGLTKKRIAAGSLAMLTAAIAVAGVLAASGGAGTNATFKGALISDVGHFNDTRFNQSQFNGLNRPKSKMEVCVLHAQSKH